MEAPKIDRTVDGGTLVGIHDAAMKTITSTQAFVDHLAARNFDQLARTMAPDAVARFLLPRGAQETGGADAIARRFEGWFGSASGFTVLSTNHQMVGGRSLIEWRFRLSREGRSTEVIEQVAFADAGPDGIYRLDLLCSGFLPDDVAMVDALSCNVPNSGL
jgi:hypothetical protein